MGRTIFFITLLLTFFLINVDAQRCRRLRFRVTRGTSRDARGLKRIVDRFNRDLGGDDNMSKRGPLRRGRRSINWDADAVPFDMPGSF